MAYLGDIRENSISPEGIIWENDNRKDARYYWNGAFIDLCDIPGEDYAKTIFVTNGSSSSDTPVEPSKATNAITIEIVKYTNDNNEEVYAYKAYSKLSVTSDMSIEFVIRNSENEEETIKLSIKNGSNSSETYPTSVLSNVPQPKVVTSSFNPKEDETFKYNLVLPKEEVVLPMAYTLTLKKGEIDTLNDSELKAKLTENARVSMKDETTSEKFKIELVPIAVDGLSNMTVPEARQAQIDNSQDLIIVTDNNIVSIEQSNAPFNEIDLWTKRNSGITINGTKFTIWYKRDVNDTTQSKVYDPVTGVIYGADKDKEYIIYYE